MMRFLQHRAVVTAVGLLALVEPARGAASPGPQSRTLDDPAGYALSFQSSQATAAGAGSRLAEIAEDPLFSHQTDKIRAALEKGADPGVRRVFGLTPLHLAALRGQTDAIELLLKKGADVNAKLSDDAAGAAWTVAGLINSKDARKTPLSAGLTPLHLSVAYHHDKAAALLADHKADLDAANSMGETPLKYALRSGSREAARVLVLRGADVLKTDSRGETILMAAALAGDIRVAQQALKKGADVNRRSGTGMTALSFAAGEGHREIVELLLRHKAALNYDAQGVHAIPPLFSAVSTGRTEISEQLILRGASLSAKNPEGHTLLVAAVLSKSLPTVKLIVSKGAPLDERVKYGVTALMLAAMNGYRDSVIYLLRQGADPRLRAENGLNAYDAAAAKGHKEVAELLRAAAAGPAKPRSAGKAGSINSLQKSP